MIFSGMLTAGTRRFTAGIPNLLGTNLYTPFFTWAVQLALLTWALYQWRRLRAMRG